jgi:hypothetical protein
MADATIMLKVEWYTTPMASRRQVYDSDLHVPIIGNRPATALDLAATFPAALVVPVNVIVMKHPTRSMQQVVLPVNNDIYWLECAGFAGPEL